MNKKILKSVSGQAIAELVVMVPVLIILMGVAMSVAYMCWQGLKVQEAANYAARIQGQQRVGGGTSEQSINLTNGLGGDTDPGTNMTDNMSDGDMTGYVHPESVNKTSVYGQYYTVVKNMFTESEQKRLIVPRAKQGTDIDQVNVIRVMSSPKIFGVQIPQVVVTGTAYGGEDTNMNALPRWGCTGHQDNCATDQQYWAGSLRVDPRHANASDALQ